MSHTTGRGRQQACGEWLRTDEERQAVSALSVACDHLAKMRNDPDRWLWVIVSLHSAVQGFMVLALKGTSKFNVVEPERGKGAERREGWLERYMTDLYGTGSSGLPRLQLLRFLDLYKKAKAAALLKPSGQQGRSVMDLNRWRNEIIHFIPKSWCFHMRRLLHVVRDSADMIESLGFRNGRFRWSDEKLACRARGLLKKAIRLADKLEGEQRA